MKSVIDYLREMQNAQTAQAAPGAQICRRVPLPEVFELPRRFGLTWGCLQKGVFNGLDAVVAEVRARGVYIRYALPYDAGARRYMAEYRARKEWLGWGGLSPTLADALYELADRREVRLERKIRNIYHGIGAEYQYYAVVDGVEIDGRFCNGLSPRECVEEVERYVEERRREAVRREVREAVERWFYDCFDNKYYDDVIVRRFEHYYAMCQMRRAAEREFSYIAYHVLLTDLWMRWRRGFWWDGEYLGRPLSCFITYDGAKCRWGEGLMRFLVKEAEDGVYIKPDTPLVDHWAKVAHRGEL